MPSVITGITTFAQQAPKRKSVRASLLVLPLLLLLPPSTSVPVVVAISVIGCDCLGWKVKEPVQMLI